MSEIKKAAVLGGRTGLLGRTLTLKLIDEGYDVYPLGRENFDPFNTEELKRFISSFKPDWLFNCVAYTAVDKAEDEPEEAMRLNRDLPALLGEACAKAKVGLVHYGSDFVFSGQRSEPYSEDDTPNPQSVYGASKLAGDEALLALDIDRLLILRTAWIFGPGKVNFVSKILELAKTRESLGIVADQIGSPTCTLDIAAHSCDLLSSSAYGVFNVVNSGAASWYELAAKAVEMAKINCEVRPIASHEYPQKAKRPEYSVLSTAKLQAATGKSPRPWSKALAEYLGLLGYEISPGQV